MAIAVVKVGRGKSTEQFWKIGRREVESCGGVGCVATPKGMLPTDRRLAANFVLSCPVINQKKTSARVGASSGRSPGRRSAESFFTVRLALSSEYGLKIKHGGRFSSSSGCFDLLGACLATEPFSFLLSISGGPTGVALYRSCPLVYCCVGILSKDLQFRLSPVPSL